MKKRIYLILGICCLFCAFMACSSPNKEERLITLAVAASLKNCMDEKLIPAFKKTHPDVKIQASYDSSGRLQTQIEQGAAVDVFMSAAMKQMNVLLGGGLIIKDSIVQLLENKIVLIVPVNNPKDINVFTDIIKADQIAIGDPASVPAGQYAKESLVNLGLWELVSAKASLGMSVFEVLNWVAEGSAAVGIVYATDAAANNRVRVVASAPPASVKKIIYPVGVVKSTKNAAVAGIFVEFLSSAEALAIFSSYGFSANK